MCGFDQFSTSDNCNANSIEKKMLALRYLWSFFKRLISLYIYAFVTERVELLLNCSRYKYVLY